MRSRPVVTATVAGALLLAGGASAGTSAPGAAGPPLATRLAGTTLAAATGGATALVAPGCAVSLSGDQLPAGPGCAALPGRLAGRLPGPVPGEAPRPLVAPGAAPAAEPCLPGVPLVDDRCEASVGGFDTAAFDAPGAGLGSGEVVAASPDGSTGYTAVTSRSGDDGDLVVLAQDGATGLTRWTGRVAALGSARDVTAIGLTVDPAGRGVYTAVVAGCGVAAVVAHDAASGALRWTTARPAPDGGCVTVRAVETDPAGDRVVLVGHTTDADGTSRSWVEALDVRDGQSVWDHSSDGGFEAGLQASALTVTADAVLVAGGGLRHGAGFPVTHAWTLTTLHAASGAVRSVGRWDAPEQRASAPANPPAGVRVTPDGTRAVVTGGAEGVTLFDLTTVAFDPRTGAVAWQAAYEGPRGKYVKSSFDSVWYHRPLVLSPDGRRAYIAGYSTSLHGVNLSHDFVTLAYDVATGALLWTAERRTDEWINWLPSVSVAPDGRRVYLSGQSRHFQLVTAHYETVAMDAGTGTVAWVGRYADGLAYWSGAALSGDGSRLFVAGTRAPSAATAGAAGSYAAVTVAYATP